MVDFNRIPSTQRAPFFYAEVNSGGSPYAGNPRLLLIGQKTSAGAAPAGVPFGPVQSAQDAIAQFGLGSMLHSMYLLAVRNAPLQPIWALPLADPAGAAAEGLIEFTAPAVTGAGVLRVMGRRLIVQVLAADNAAAIVSKVIAVINAANLPIVAATVVGEAAQVGLTARHVGALGNTIQVEVPTDEPNVFTPTNAAVTALSGGSGVPSLDTPLANLGDQEYDWLAGPYADTASLNSVKAFLDDTAGRWSPAQMLYGHYTTAVFDTLSNLVTLGNGRNDPHVSIMGSQVSPTPPWEWAAALGAIEVLHLANPPELSRPLQSLALDGVLPPTDRSKWWSIANRNALYSDGVAGYEVLTDGKVVINRLVTTYQVTAQGVADTTFMDVETMAQIMYLSRYFRTAVSARHGRQALADDNPHNVSAITTPDDIRNTLVHAYQDLVALGVAENAALFARSLVVERDPLNANRVNTFLPVDVVNQLRIFAANITVFLQYNTAGGQAQVPPAA